MPFCFGLVFCVSTISSMYTVVSLTIDLAGEPDTIDFTLVWIFFSVFGVFIVIDFWEVTDRVTGRPRTLEKCAHVRHVDPIQPNRDALFRLEKNRPSPFFFSSSPLFLPPFCLTELQFGEPFPARLHVLLGGFLRRR